MNEAVNKKRRQLLAPESLKKQLDEKVRQLDEEGRLSLAGADDAESFGKSCRAYSRRLGMVCDQLNAAISENNQGVDPDNKKDVREFVGRCPESYRGVVGAWVQRISDLKEMSKDALEGRKNLDELKQKVAGWEALPSFFEKKEEEAKGENALTIIEYPGAPNQKAM